jgi:alkylation response protein AidB-like acyl-CoA dehydrogenase
VSGPDARGGWRITGQCPFGSGCHNAQWLAMPAIEMDGDHPKLDASSGQPTILGVLFPRSQATLLDTWHTLGMRGTGSTDYVVADLFVPDRFVAQVAPLKHPAPGFGGPLFGMWPWTVILGEATVSVGVAAAAVDAAVQLYITKTPPTTRPRYVSNSLPNSRSAKPGPGSRHARHVICCRKPSV